MNNEILYLIIGAGLSLFSIIVADIFRLIIDSSLSEKRMKREYVYKVYNNRIEAYRELYTQLVKYKRIFVDTSFIVIVEGIILFEYKTECEKLLEFFQEHEVYFNNELVKVIQVMLVNNLNNLDYLPTFIEPGNLSDNALISKHSKDTIDCIDKCLNIIKKELKIEEIDKAF